jgi:metal-responsive CopG/Arc/MetJ family transcriptional regulator
MSKVKISVSIDQVVLQRVSRLSQGSSRSDIVERALRRWLAERRRRQLEDEIAAYYLQRLEEERREDEEWARASARHLGKG